MPMLKSDRAIIIKEMQIKITTKYHLTPVRMSVIKIYRQ